MNFLKTSFYSGISTAVSFITKLITNKIVAVYLGTHGMFLIGQLRDFLKITTVVSSFGTLNGTIKYTAEHKDDKQELKTFLGTGLKVHLLCSILVIILTILFKDKLSYYLFKSDEFSNYLIILAISVASISIHTLFVSILNGLRKIKLYVVITIIATLISAAILIIAVMKYDITGAFYAIALNQFLTFLISLALIIIYKPFSLQLLLGVFNFNKLKQLSQFSLMAIAGPVCLISATFFVRYFLSSEFDEIHAGSWEGMWRISALYLLFLTTTFKFYLLPTFSVLKGNDLKKEVFKVWKYIFPTVIIMGLLVYLVKDEVIILLFSKEFLLINTLIVFQLLGDSIKINCWVLGNILISKAKSKVFILFQIEWAIVFSILTLVFVKQYGFVGVSLAYFVAYIIHFLLMNLYFKNLLWSKKLTFQD